jgi:N-acetyl-alpha-D-muramate 1-phosphate uridylyltransferase
MSAISLPALVLAAGRGERMRPLTDTTPKPLLRVQGKPLMQWHLQALVEAGCPRAVINTAWLGEAIESAFGPNFELDGARVPLHYSHEGRDFGGALETLGGICRALPLLSPDRRQPFWVVAGDVYAPGFPFGPSMFEHVLDRFQNAGLLGHLWLVPNPPHNPKGDFAIRPDGRASNAECERSTFSTLAIYHPDLFNPPLCTIPAGNPTGITAPLGPFLRKAIDQGFIGCERYDGPWTDVGTPERLAALNEKSPF